MIIPKNIRNKMHSAAGHFARGAEIMREVDAWFEEHGFDMDELRCGDGTSLEEIEYGNDITDELCKKLEGG